IEGRCDLVEDFLGGSDTSWRAHADHARRNGCRIRFPGFAQQAPKVIRQSILFAKFDTDHRQNRSLPVVNSGRHCLRSFPTADSISAGASGLEEGVLSHASSKYWACDGWAANPVIPKVVPTKNVLRSIRPSIISGRLNATYTEHNAMCQITF